MAHVVFYEKPGCVNNSKQKRLLIDAGHLLECRDLLAQPWTRESLLEFFDQISVSMWFNNSAPDIKSGLIDPSALSKDMALALMIKNPILIRRPLMRVGNEYRIGFDPELVDQWIGLAGFNGEVDLEHCQRKSVDSCKSPAAQQDDGQS
jgi:nitrogenase-associated protein